MLVCIQFTDITQNENPATQSLNKSASYICGVVKQVFQDGDCNQTMHDSLASHIFFTYFPAGSLLVRFMLVRFSPVDLVIKP